MSPSDRAASLQAHAAALAAQFMPKSDVAAPPALLRALREDDPARWGITPAVAAQAAGGGHWQALPAHGTFHAVFADQGGSGTRVMRISKLAVALAEHSGTPWVDWQMHTDALLGPWADAQVDTTRQRLPFDVAVLPRVTGTPLTALDADDAAIAPALAALARCLRTLHARTGSGHGPVDVRPWVLHGERRPAGLWTAADGWHGWLTCRLPEHLQQLTEAGLIDAASAARSLAWLADPAWTDGAPTGCLLHGDPGNHNAFVGVDGEVTLIDWEDALLGDPQYDLAAWAGFHPERRWAAFFEAYAGQPWTPGARFWRYYLRMAIARSVHRLRFGIADRPGRPPAAARITRALQALDEVGA